MTAEYISKICGTVWDLPRLRARTILGSIAVRLLANSTRPQSERPEEDFLGNALPRMQIIGNVALIPLRGPISMNVPDWIKAYGFDLTDANDIEEEINRALADANVDLIVFDVDSPGGWDLASLKLFELVEAANKKKPCFAYCGDGCDMASGAYYAVAAATAIYAGWYADGVGCIGCYLAWLDDSEYWENLGVKFEVFRSGELKGLGIDGLSEAQKNYLQGMVNESGDRFRKNVLKYRTGIARADLEGQWFEGSIAAKRGFVAGCVDNLEAAIAKFRKML
jgi:ClpP class serine protease